MFNIYSDGVRSFSGTLEHLVEVRAIERVAAVRREVDGEGRRARREAAAAAAEDPAYVTPRAIAAYREATRQTSRETIVHAEQLMQAPVRTIAPGARILEAWQRLRSERVRQLPVESSEGRLVGMLSEGELLGHLEGDDERLQLGGGLDVASVMRREVITAEPVTDVRRIARVLADHGLTAMPVVTAEQELVGIVSRGDLLRALTRDPPLHLWM